MTARTALAACLAALVVLFLATAAPAGRTPGDKTPPKGPTNLRLTATGPTSASLAWDAASAKSSNWWYCVRRDGLGCIRVEKTQTTISFSRLWQGTTFNWSVIAIDANGNKSAPSNTVTYTTPPDTTPPSPAPTVSATGVWPTRIGVAWTASTDDVTQVWYSLAVDGAPFPAGQIGWLSSLLLYLEPGSTHTFQVTARDHFGNATTGNLLTVTTPEVTDVDAPTAPTNLRLSSETSAPEIWLDWDPSTDDTDPQAVLGYDVLVNGVRDHTAIGAAETILYCPVTGPFTITVRAVDTSGNVSGPSNELDFVC